MSWRDELLTSEQSAAERYWCSHRQVDKETDSDAVWASHKTRKESWTNNVKILKKMKKMLIYYWLCDFKVPKVSHGKVSTLNRWGGKINHLSMVYSVSNFYHKLLESDNYC